MAQITWTKLDSSNVSDATYNPDRKIMALRFHNGGLYTYEGVDEDVYTDLVHAESVGRFLAQQIKGRYDYQRWFSDDELSRYLVGSK